MDYEWDPAKAAANLAKHGMAFEAMARFEWQTAVRRPDRREYGAEMRFIAVGLIGDRLHTCIYTMRDGVRGGVRGEACRIISLWKSNNRDIKRFMEASNAEDQEE